MWKTIGDHFRYEINANGEVRKKAGLEVNENVELVNGYENNYKTISLYGNDYQLRTRKIHELVAAAFLTREPGLTYIIHKDYNFNNNHKDNLQYASKEDYDTFIQEQNFFEREHMINEITPVVEEATPIGEEAQEPIVETTQEITIESQPIAEASLPLFN